MTKVSIDSSILRVIPPIGKIISKIKKIQLRYSNSQLNKLWSEQKYILENLPKVDADFYRANISIVELEHQVGRFLNMRDVISEIKKEKIEGDIVEFGSWQGLGLLILNLCFGQHDRKLIGIDSFEGLPETSTIWNKGDFHNTSVNQVTQNIATYAPNKESFTLIKGWFNDEAVVERLHKETKSIALVHFDADLGSSTTQALKVIEPYLRDRIDPIYFLFDDWGCNQDEVPDAFLNWVINAQKLYNFEAHKVCTTRLTRYYKITFNSRV